MTVPAADPYSSNSSVTECRYLALTFTREPGKSKVPRGAKLFQVVTKQGCCCFPVDEALLRLVAASVRHSLMEEEVHAETWLELYGKVNDILRWSAARALAQWQMITILVLYLIGWVTLLVYLFVSDDNISISLPVWLAYTVGLGWVCWYQDRRIHQKLGQIVMKEWKPRIEQETNGYTTVEFVLVQLPGDWPSFTCCCPGGSGHESYVIFRCRGAVDSSEEGNNFVIEVVLGSEEAGTIQKHHFHLVDIQDANGTVSLTKLWNLLATAESNVVQVIPNSFLYEYSEDKYVTVSSDMELRNAIDAAQAYGGSILTLFGSDK